MSSGQPFTPSGTASADMASRSGGALASGLTAWPTVSQIGVSIRPGCTEFTRMPSLALAHSMAIDLVNSRTPPLVAQ